MKTKRSRTIVISIAVILLLTAAFTIYKLTRVDTTMISEFGKYQGYTPAIYDGTKRTSDYLTLSDGTRLAYDVVIPTKKGIPADKPLPVLFKYTPYGRTWTIFDKNGKFLVGQFVDLPSNIMAHIRYWVMGYQGRFMDPLWRDKWLEPVVKHGYIVVSVDAPATGASFPSPTLGGMEAVSKFENEIIDWIAAQPWSDGNVGMYGDSYEAMVQLTTAAAGNPHLKAILPASSNIQIYQAVEYPGGVYNQAFAALLKTTLPFLDQLATPVDSDPDGALLAQARESRKDIATYQTVVDWAPLCPYQDSLSPDGSPLWQEVDLYPFIDRINRSNVAIYMTVGWYDVFTADMFYWYNNLTVPKRLTVRPTDHSQVMASLSDLDYGAEAMRWLDYWLKGIDNGVMSEPPIHYYVQDGPKSGSWMTSDQWPLATQKLTAYSLGPGRSGTVASINDGTLTLGPAEAGTAPDAYTVDYTTTTGPHSRWGAVEEAHIYPDLSARDAKALTYTTPPLATDRNVTGHPVVHLWLATAAPDLDAFVYLEEVDDRGKATYVTEGTLRASHRKLSQAPFNVFGLPYQSHLQADQLPVPAGEPIELTFSLLPTSYRFHAGSHIRITVAFADAGNFDTPVLTPAPTVNLLRDADHPSVVELPLND